MEEGQKFETFREYALSEFENIVNGISDKEFYDSLQNKETNINWPRLMKAIKKEIMDALTVAWNEMWETENLDEKLKILDTIKKKCVDANRIVWRPTTGDIRPQVNDLNLRLQTMMAEHFTEVALKEEDTVAGLKRRLTEEWDKLRDHEKAVAECRRKCVAVRCAVGEKQKELTSQIKESYFM